ncbi:hypothetical protein AN958_08242 [Leucoagaricus sp. SymC.cos]|nr:hypothetical protein AN958_08242 [Leucoagaricus sp. SymC.cos]
MILLIKCLLDVVCPESNQVGLIDSIFRNFYVPTVIFSINTQEHGSGTRICIDGKQRLTSIYRFVSGLVSFHFSSAHLSLTCSSKIYHPVSVDSKRKYQTLLPEKYQRLFDLDDKNEIFQMQNTGSISQFERFLDHANTFIDELSSGRAEGVPGAAASKDEVVTGAFRINAADFEYGIGGSGPVREDKVSPIQFIWIALLILVWRDKMSLRAMAKAIREMRREVRSEHVDVWMNTRVGKTMITFFGKSKVKEEVKEKKIGNKRKRTAADGEDEEMASASESSTPSAKRNSKTTMTTVNKGRLVVIRMAAQQHLSRDTSARCRKLSH